MAFIEKSRFHDFPVVNPEGKYLGVIHFDKVRNHIYNPVTDRKVTAVSLSESSSSAISCGHSIKYPSNTLFPPVRGT